TYSGTPLIRASFLLTHRRPPSSTPFPYTTLFRSGAIPPTTTVCRNERGEHRRRLLTRRHHNGGHQAHVPAVCSARRNTWDKKVHPHRTNLLPCSEEWKHFGANS